MNSYANFDPELDDSNFGKDDHHQKHRDRNSNWGKNKKSKDSHDDDDDDDGLSLANLSNLDSNGNDLDLAEYIKSRNNNSKMQQHRLYGTYGESTPLTLAPNSPAVTYGYTGAEYDLESNTYYLRARNYDPVSGKFLTKDPLGPHQGGDINPYRYALNNPINFIDPKGMVFASINLSGTASGSAALISATVDQGTTFGYGPSGLVALPVSTGSSGFGPAIGASAGGSASITIGLGDTTDILGQGYSGSLALGPLGTFSIGFSQSGTLSLGYSNGVGLQFGIYGGQTQTVLGSATNLLQVNQCH